MIIGGVPEHFNHPWQLLIGENKLVIEKTPVSWKDFGGGTGAMIEALENDSIQMALLLTEGAVAAISKGADLKIVSLYVTTPLVWGIHTPGNSAMSAIEDIREGRIAISRYGSGSHLMAFVDANERGWPTDSLQFEVIGNLNGAREAFKNGKAEVFLWEKFTTKPYVDSGEFKRVGERPTPWPCFMLVAKPSFLEKNSVLVQKLLTQLFETISVCNNNPTLINEIAAAYQLKSEDVAKWKKATSWAQNTEIKQEELETVRDYLLKLNLIDKKLPAADLCSSFVTLT